MNEADRTCAFYAVADARHFLGLVAMVNSLRLVGHEETIFVADLGLADAQRRLLDDHVTVVATERAQAPHLVKTALPRAHPADVMVLIDADVIVTRPLSDLVETARSGKIVAFTDDVGTRFDARWGELLGLGELQARPYVNSGLLAANRAVGATLLEQVAAGCALVDHRRSFVVADSSPDYPFYYLDQDVLNAVLASRPAEQVAALDHLLAPFPPFPALRIVDESRLRCAYEDGLEPYLLHHISEKPWLHATRWSIYSRLLRRLLLAPDLPIRLEPAQVPLRLRDGRLSWLEQRRCHAVASLGRVRGRLGLRRELARRLRGHSRMDGAPPAGEPVR